MGIVIAREDDHRPHAGKFTVDIRPRLRRAREPSHVRVMACIEPSLKTAERVDGLVGRGEPASVEAEIQCETACVFGTGIRRR
jgi:hypothetical protein